MAENVSRVVRELPVIPRQGATKKPTAECRKLNVTFYARVSTENPEQEDSYERQQDHYIHQIQSNPNWNYVEGYADWGVTGTRADARENFMRMIEDCRAGKIDRILCKSVSRFARNTVDTLNYIQELKELGISIYFESQAVDTLTPGGELLITVLAAMAEQESRTMSTNIKWAFQKRFKDGDVIINFHATLGYTKVGKKEYGIVESEAEIVRRIFREYLSGRSLRELAAELNAEGIHTKLGHKWMPSSIEGVLKNEKYTGNSILGKSYKPDVLSKTRRVNNGEAPRYYVENSHPAIITQEMFDMVQAERRRRAELRSPTMSGIGRYSAKYPYSGMLICAECGGKLRRFGRKSVKMGYTATWVCITHQTEPQKCSLLPIREFDIDMAYERALKRLLGDTTDIISAVKRNIDEVVTVSDEIDLAPILQRLKDIQTEIHEIFQKRRKGEIEFEEYNRRYAELANEYDELQKRESAAKELVVKKQIAQKRLVELGDALMGENMDYTAPAMKRLLIDYIRVIGKHEIEFQFKCGIMITERI